MVWRGQRELLLERPVRRLSNKYQSFVRSLAGANTVALVADNPTLKTETLASLCKYLASSHQQVHYVDLDLQFSSLVQNYRMITGFGFPPVGSSINVGIPQVQNVSQQIIDFLCDPELRPGGAFVIDSINSLQNLVRVGNTDSDSVIANHKVAILITMIQELARHFSKTLWISNITRNRPISSDGETQWDKGLAGGRMMLMKSDVIVTLEAPAATPSSASSSYVANVKRRGSAEESSHDLGLE